MTELLLARHGQTDWNLAGRYQGRIDVPLNSAGRRQAEELAAELAGRPIDAIYCSGLSRALDTARAIARGREIDVCIDRRLNEIDQGEWEGLLSTEIETRYSELYRQWQDDPRSVRPPGGESIRRVHDRVVAAAREISAAHPGGKLCLVSHKTVMVVLRCHFLGVDLLEEMRRMPPNAHWESLRVSFDPADGWAPGASCCSAA